MKRKRYHNNTSFLDVLFNALLGFVFLFIIAFMAMNVSSKKGDIQTKAEFVITVTWEDESQDDVDTWLQDPKGNILFFRQKDIGLMHLDRDDLGIVNDKVTTLGGDKYEYIYNQEMTTIRGFIPGEWVLNLHMYNKRDPGPVSVMVRIDKLNPRAETVFQKTLEMTTTGEEITIARFTMNAQGEITHWDNLPKSLVMVAGGGGSRASEGSAPTVSRGM
jgi:hypothetical protein